MTAPQSVRLDSSSLHQLLKKREEYENRIARRFHEHDPAMLALEHAKIFLITLLLNRFDQNVAWNDFVTALEADQVECERCSYIGSPYGSSLEEAWRIVERYIDETGTDLLNSTGLPVV